MVGAPFDDGAGPDSGSAYVFVTPEEAVQDLTDFVGELEPSSFSNPNSETALTNELNEVLHKIEAGDLASIGEGIDKLTNDILPKTDGETPPPDWVTDPPAQQHLEDQIVAIIGALQDEADALGSCP